MNRPMSAAERRAYNQRRHAEQRRQQVVAERGDQGVAELWWDQARKIARDRAADGDDAAWNDLALTLSNYCQRYGA